MTTVRLKLLEYTSYSPDFLSWHIAHYIQVKMKMKGMWFTFNKNLPSGWENGVRQKLFRKKFNKCSHIARIYGYNLYKSEIKINIKMSF